MALGLELERLNGIAVVTLDDPERPLNTLGEPAVAAFGEVLDRLEADPPRKGVLLLSAKENSFVAGADLLEFQRMESAEAVTDLLRRGQAMLGRWERLGCVSVAAIRGPALGGGLELALGCTWRVAADDPATSLGLPETQLGLLPAMAGTWHLPRLVGLEQGVAMILTGRRLNAAQAFKTGLVDEVVPPEELRAAAERMLERGPRRVSVSLRDRLFGGNPIGRRIFFGAARRRTLGKTRGHYPAPLRALQAIEAGYARGREAGLASEAEGIGELLVSDVSRRLIELFLATRELAGTDEERRGEPGTLGVLGAGFMGSGIAAAAARAGYRVRLMDTSPESLERGLEFCRRRFASLARRGKLEPKAAEAARDRISAAGTLDGFEEVDLAIEAVFEDEEVKRRLLADLEPRLGPDAILGSNTSTIPIGRLARALERPERLVGIHFFSPVHRMPLVEVIRHPGSSDEAARRAVVLAARLGKTPIVVADGPGFYTSRILSPYLAQGAAMLLEGAGIAEVDAAARAAGFPVGPLELLDEVGIDVAAHAAHTMAAAFPERMPQPDGFRRLVEQGRLGRKSGRGFYDYSSRKKRPDPRVLGLLEGERTPARLDPESTGERLVLAMAVEAVRCLEEGILPRPLEGDVGAVLGLGFPPFTGGPFRYLDALGTTETLSRLEKLSAAHGPVFAAPGLLHSRRGGFHE
ncbi:MAG: 3-hydroxyacyl-CoA dehydrogenase NAD-binding domain-containing protein [Thermoanaerobaculia bacterium]